MFKDRKQAGELLAEKLADYKNKKNTLVFGLIRGGVVTAAAIAQKLNLPLLALPIKKIKHPFQPELALGAVGPEETVYYNHELVVMGRLDPKGLAIALLQAQKEQKEAEKKFFNQKINWENKTIILVDDGIATGATMEASILFLRKKKDAQIIIATPVIAIETLENLRKKVDTVITLETPADFTSVGEFYKEFEQVGDEEVIKILANSKS